ncbi:CMRF35-like molecule 1 isoform X2 [Oreochromis niloticus]|uniref:CMRF35-like molecule 1 isoform X2 n=1 Tax=Oreochromis niloticus TaxID=8128 RepID=UPI000674EB6A|nr:CMRF35-like molecule 1 isoform X2 [Oreochromis niloticus]
MEMTLIFLIFLLEGLWETKAISVTGNKGSSITVTCSHSNAYYNVKYFCKGQCTDKDILINSTTISNKKYKIEDKGNTFSVTISDLKEDDSGTYWCGIERVGLDTYTQVTLTVLGWYYDLVFRSCQKQDACHDKNASPSKEDQETDGGTKSANQHQDTSEPQKESGNLIYTTVTFTNQTESSMVSSHCVASIKSSSKPKSTEESTIYSNISTQC